MAVTDWATLRSSSSRLLAVTTTAPTSMGCAPEVCPIVAVWPPEAACATVEAATELDGDAGASASATPGAATLASSSQRSIPFARTPTIPHPQCGYDGRC